MSIPVLVMGSGGLGKEILSYLVEDPRYEIVGVVSTEDFNNPEYANLFPVKETADAYRPTQDVRLIMATAFPKTKRSIVLANYRWASRWINYVAPGAVLSRFARIGTGCTLTPNSSIVGDPKVGDFVFLNTESTIGHDAQVGDYVTLFPKSEICGDCVVGEDVIFGLGAAALPKVKIVAGAKIAAGAVVWKDVTEPVTMVGNPAKPLIKGNSTTLLLDKVVCPICDGHGVESFGIATFPCRACNPRLVPAT